MCWGKVEAAAAKDELKRLRKEMLRLKNEWTTLKALYESAKVHLPRPLLSFTAIAWSGSYSPLCFEMLLLLQHCTLFSDVAVCRKAPLHVKHFRFRCLLEIRQCSYLHHVCKQCWHAVQCLHVDVSSIEKHVVSVAQIGMLKRG